MTDTTVIDVRHVAFGWPGKNGFELGIPAFAVERGETVLLLGESGSGKSTLLSLICGTVLPRSGTVEINGTDITKLRGGARDKFRADNIGVVFQQFNLLPFGTVRDNIVLPLQFAANRRRNVTDPYAEVTRLCQSLGLPDAIETRRAADLSVGQQQRVAVARALIGAPPLLIADEPTSALDENHQRQFLDVLFAQVHAQGASLVMVSHDPRLAARFDRHLQMSDIVAEAAPIT